MDTILTKLFIALSLLQVTLASNVITVDNVATKDVQTIQHIEEKDLPEVLLEIARCESGNKQFTSSGSIIRGYANPNDIGRWQISWTYHSSTIQKMGLDIMTEEGNRDYAYWLYKTQGTKPWRLSEKCWNK